MVEVDIVKCSFNTTAKTRITTFACKYPFVIHAELLTHRALSRNAQSKRAIPVERFVQQTRENMFVPNAFTKNCKGMQAKGVLDEKDGEQARKLWLQAGVEATKYAEKLAAVNMHKEYANRVLEPFSHMTTLITATNLANFFSLRNHTDAHPEIRALAVAMQEAWEKVVPVLCKPGDWHIPYDHAEDKELDLDSRIKISTARCARVSYLTHDGRRDPEADLTLYERLRTSKPLHASPFEHCAQAMPYALNSGNFVGWHQFRKMLPNESVEEYNYDAHGMVV